jgi:hypothetical protein
MTQSVSLSLSLSLSLFLSLCFSLPLGAPFSDMQWHCAGGGAAAPQVMGVWQPGMDGSDLNALHRSHAQRHVVSAVSANQLHRRNRICGGGGEMLTHALTATLYSARPLFCSCGGQGDDGQVRLYNYPCVVHAAPPHTSSGHSSHVSRPFAS